MAQAALARALASEKMAENADSRSVEIEKASQGRCEEMRSVAELRESEVFTFTNAPSHGVDLHYSCVGVLMPSWSGCSS